MRTQLVPVLTLAAIVAFAAAALSVAGPPAAPDARARSTTVAEARTGDFRVLVSATRTSGGAAPTARATAVTFGRQDGRWARTGSHTIAGTYFWKTLTGPRAICRLELRTADPGARFRPQAIVQLLASPSLGCGRVSSYALAG